MTSRTFDLYYDINGPQEEWYIEDYDNYYKDKRDWIHSRFEEKDSRIDKDGVMWKTIPECSNYQISEDGRIMSFVKPDKPKMMSYYTNRYGHHYTDLIDDNGKKRKCLVHRLVAMAFSNNLTSLPIVMHLDDDPDNNDIMNLRWGTPADNVEDCINKGRNYTKPVYCYNNRRTYISCAEAAMKLGVSRALITNCCKGEIHTAKGFSFCYLEDKRDMSSKDLRIKKASSLNTMPVRATNIETRQTMTFESRRKASEYLGIPNCGISSCITGHLTHTHGWMFENVEREKYYEQDY